MATSNPIDVSAEIVKSFITNNSVPRGELPALIEAVYVAVKRLAERSEAAAPAINPQAPAVSIHKSVTPDYLICLEDGKRFKSMRRHLTMLGMTPEQYRAKWNLPSTYPMVAPNYTAQRSTLAKNLGFGLRETPVAAEPTGAEESETVVGAIELIVAEPVVIATIEAGAAEPASPGVSEVVIAAIEVAAPEPVSVATIEAAQPEPASPAKTTSRRKTVAAPPESVGESEAVAGAIGAVANEPASAGKTKSEPKGKGKRVAPLPKPASKRKVE